MKKLKLFILMAFAMIATAANAQFAFGVKGGVNVSNVYGEGFEVGNPLIGFHAGLITDVYFTPDLLLKTGLTLGTKGNIDKEDRAEYTSILYLQLPLHIAYRVEVMPGTNIIFHGGPYAAYGVYGKSVTKVDGKKESNKIEFGSDISQLKPFDAGVGFGVSAEFGFFLIDVGYDIGFVNMANTSAVSIKNQNAYLSLGIRF